MKSISKMMVCVLGAGLMLNFASCIHDAGEEIKKVPVELKTCDVLNGLFETVAGGLDNPKHFAKSKTKPENPVYFLDVAESEVPLWYDEESRTLYYYIEEGKTLGLRSLAVTHDYNLKGLFMLCKSIESIDTSDFDTSNLTNMTAMFWDCYELKKIDLSNFDTRKVTDMSAMFLGCYSLEELDLSNFDTKNVTDMCAMFFGCTALEELDLSNFDTGNVTQMAQMFSDSSLKELDLSSFDTSSVIDMRYMFGGCELLSKVDVTNFDTRNVTIMYYMFGDCISLKELDLSNFDTSNVTNMISMFSYCLELTKVTVSDKFVTNDVEDSGGMFNNCPALKGGAGIIYNVDHVDKEYARIDGGPDKPGYFTAKE